MIQRAVAEVVFADRGYSPTDLYGVDRDTVTVTERYDLAASLRRACAACGRFRVTLALSVAFVAASFVGVHTASYGAGILAAAFAVAAYASSTAPEWVYERPEPRWSWGSIQSDGLTDDEYAVRLGVFRERDEYRKELQEEERKKAEKDAKRKEKGGAFGTPPPRR